MKFRFWSIIVGAALLVAALLVEVAPREYSTTAVVSVTPRADESPPPASMITLLSKSYVAFASSDQTAQKISSSTGVPVQDIQRGTTVTMPAGTTNVQVKATMDSPGRAALVAGAVSALLVVFSQYDSTLTAATVVPAAPPRRPELDGIRPLVVEGLATLGVLALAAGAITATRRRPAT